MGLTINWTRFAIGAGLATVFVIAVSVLWHGQIAAPMYANYPLRPKDELQDLFPFLMFTFIIQIPILCYLYLRANPQRSIAAAAKFGFWAGLFSLAPTGQFWVGTPGVEWDFLIMQYGQGTVTVLLAILLFQAVVQPASESWSWPRIDFGKFIPWALGGAVLVFVLDLPAHQILLPRLFSGYPASDYPHRATAEAPRYLALLATYLYQLSFFSYLYLRFYRNRSLGAAVWFGAWMGFWILIPNAQIFSIEDKFTWRMLSIQFVEGMILMMIMMFYFELAYRPKQSPRFATAE
jgi:hypothetical protein